MTTTPTDRPFDPHATTYSLNNAYWLAQAADIAYEEKHKIQPAVAKLGLKNFEFLSKDDTEGYIAANENIIVVAFRGTEPTHLQDLLADARLHKVQGPWGEIHRGFLHAFELVKDDVYNAIQRLRDKNTPQSLWCTGHSLGAALAVLAVAHLLTDGQTVNGLYNFGQPRVGNPAFADEFNRRFSGRHFRFVHNNDAVTRVPPRSFGYSHTGALRYIDSSGQIQEDISFWQQFLDRVTGRMEDFLKPGTDGLKDHSMSLYVQHLEAALKSGA
ncbi:MAG: lipase family protein [Gammaproteobacteria bacterium]|nr:lipase family protein [Gammaproteobacteria bacterium]